MSYPTVRYFFLSPLASGGGPVSSGGLSLKLRSLLATLALCSFSSVAAFSQSTATLTGVVTDPTGAVVANAHVKIHSTATGGDRDVVTDSTGIYVAPSLQPGEYQIETTAAGFGAFKVEKVTLNLDAHVTINMKLAVSSAGETVEVEGGAPVIETASATVGQVIDKQQVQEIPLNGRHFLDLTVLTPGGVTGPANANLTAPSRGVGAFSFLTAGNRDDSVNFQINGINLNDIANAQIVFQPSINTTSEVKIINSSPSAEYGRNSGSVTNVSTRSGSNKFHGEVFDYLRNNSFDARNFFNPKGTAQIALKRNNFGGAIGGPLWKEKAFFFASYEALRQHQGLPVNTAVFSPAERSGVTDPISLQLLQYIPLGNVGNLYTGAIDGPVNIDQGTIDLLYLPNSKDTIHAFYANQHDIRTEPTTQANTLPGFGDHRPAIRQILTVNETHLFTPRLVNELRIGYNRVHVEFQPNFTTDPATLGYKNFPAGVKSSGGIPQLTISGYGINIGGPSSFPQGRYDTLGVVSDAATYTIGKHSMKFGGEVRRYLNANFTDDPGTLGFAASPALTDATGKVILTPARSALQNFQLGLATSFAITPQATTSRIYGNAVGVFAMDTFKVTPKFTLEYGFRFEWLGTPTYGNKQAAIFDPSTVTLGYYATSGPGNYQDAYKQNYNYMPRLGFILDAFGDGKTVLRGGYSITSDQPLSNAASGLASNPPFTSRVSYTASTTSCVQGAANCNPTIPQANLYAAAAAASISVAAVQPNFKNATTQSFNLNLQHQLPWQVAVSIGYYGSVGRHLRMTQNINQYVTPATQTRPYLKLAANSPILPGASINSNINQVSSNGQSNYNGMWLNFRKNTNKGLTLNATYQYTKSLDLGSTAGTQYTDITLPSLNYARSDFDTRNRISGNVIYLLPFKGNRLVSGYQVSGIVQWQTGNPLNLTTASAYNGTSGVQHPILLQPIQYTKQYVTNAVNWFNPGGTTNTPGGTVCATIAPGCIFYAPTNTTAGMGRNGATGPGFADFDLSLAKNTQIFERVNFQLKVDVFDIFNHPSFSNPGTSATANSATFGVITATRFPVGDLGSSRQLQISGKFTF